MKSIAAIVGILGLVGVAAGAAAQTTAPTPPSGTQPSPQVSPSPPPPSTGQPPAAQPSAGAARQAEIDVGSLVGSKVRGQDGKEVGEVDRVMADPKDGRITALVISMGGTILGGGKTLSVPWESVKFGRDGNNIVIVLEQQILDQAPKAEGEKKNGQPAASPRGEQPKDRK